MDEPKPLPNEQATDAEMLHLLGGTALVLLTELIVSNKTGRRLTGHVHMTDVISTEAHDLERHLKIRST